MSLNKNGFSSIRVPTSDIALLTEAAVTEVSRLRVEARKYRDKGNVRDAVRLEEEASRLELAVTRTTTAAEQSAAA